MTLPSLIQNYQKKVLATQTQKFYSTMSQAVKQYMADYGVDDLRNTPLASDNYGEGSDDDDGNYIQPNGKIESLRDFATKYLKVVKECEYVEDDERNSRYNTCLAPAYRRWDNLTDEYTFGFGDTSYVLADGSVIELTYDGSKGDAGPIDLFVDVNGKKGPNRNGYDFWTMSIFYDGVIDEGVTPECRKNGECINTMSGELLDNPAAIREYRFEKGCKEGGSYGGCFGHFLNNNFKFDY